MKTFLHSLAALAIGGAVTGATDALTQGAAQHAPLHWDAIGQSALVGAILTVLAVLKQSPRTVTTTNEPKP